MKNRFDEQVEVLNAQMIEMGAMIETTIEDACEALQTADLPKARAIIEGDSAVDRKEREIESLCLRMLLTRQPVAHDLRVVSSALKMITDMERIGDQAEDVAEIVCFLNGRTPEDEGLMTEMARATIKMVTESVDAYVKRDILLAEKVVGDDDAVDRYFDQVKTRLIEKIAQDPGDGEYALDLLMIAKYFERIGDHAVNIAQWVIFSVTGTHKED